MITYSLTTLGCKVNQYDGFAVASVLDTCGLQSIGKSDPDSRAADLIVVNTCCVTRTAMRKSRQAIRKAVKNAPGAAVVIVGCYCDYDPRKISELLNSLNVPPERTVISGHHDSNLLSSIQQLAHRLVRGGQASCRPVQTDYNINDIKDRRKLAVKRNVSGTQALPAIKSFPGHQRAFVKVQDGCNAFCSYCIVPYTRAVVWSRNIDEIADECSRLVSAGHREIVLSGVFLGAYGRDGTVRKRWTEKNAPIIELVRRVASIDGLWRLRLSSLEPADLTRELLALWTELPNLARHFHLPLQSGSEKILTRMNRQYSANDFRKMIDRLSNALDRPAVTTDIIVGFPGETDDDFAQTLDVARYARFSKIHAFPFSPIEGTAAWEWRNEIPNGNIVKDRLAQLRELEQEMAHSFRSQFIGDTLEALVERKSANNKENLRQAMTDRYLTVHFHPPADNNITGKIVRLKILSTTENHLEGRLEVEG